MQKAVTISPGTMSIMRANFAKGYYYGDDKSLINLLASLCKFDRSCTLKPKLDEYNSLSLKKESISFKLRMSRLGERYLRVWEREELDETFVGLKMKLEGMRTDLIQMLMGLLEGNEILEKEFTNILLKSLPLVLGDEEGEYEEEEYEGPI